MREADSTRLMAAFRWHDPRVRRLDDTWLLTIFATVLAIALPWSASGVSIDFAAAAIGLLILGAVHVALAALSATGRFRGARATRALVALHGLGILTMAFIWRYAGGLQNPLFLTVFALPVIGAVFLSRWQPYLMAALAAAVVTLLASSDAPELSWHAAGLAPGAHWLAAILGHTATSVPPLFAGFYAPSEYFVVLLEVFAIMLGACAVAAEYLGTIFHRFDAQIWAARAEAARGQALWSALLEQLPLPALLLDADTHEVIGASSAAVAKYLAGEAAVVGRRLLELLHFTYPEPVERLVNGAGGVEKLCMLRVGDRLLATEVRVQHVAQKGRRLALVMISDTMEAFCIKAALDLAEHAALVADSAGRVLAFNKPARALFSGTEVGAGVAQLVPQLDAGMRWWDPGLGGRRKMHVTVMRRLYQVTCSSVALPGEEARLYVIAFLPAAPIASADPSATGSTNLMPSQ